MRYEIQASQLSEIKKTGKVAFVDFINETQRQILAHNAEKRDSFQFCPLTKKILVNRALGDLLYEIIEQRPIKLIYSKKVGKNESFSIANVSIETIYIGIFFPFDDSPVIFFTEKYDTEFDTDGLVALYGDARARYLQKEQDSESSYLLKKGYANGDRLNSSEYPLVFK